MILVIDSFVCWSIMKAFLHSQVIVWVSLTRHSNPGYCFLYTIQPLVHIRGGESGQTSDRLEAVLSPNCTGHSRRSVATINSWNCRRGNGGGGVETLAIRRKRINMETCQHFLLFKIELCYQELFRSILLRWTNAMNVPSILVEWSGVERQWSNARSGETGEHQHTYADLRTSF